MIQKLAEWAFGLPHVREEPSGISVPGARALVLDESVEANERAFMVGREFAHIHPPPLGGSLHLNLPPRDADEVIRKGWGENHFLVDVGVIPEGSIMVYAARDDDDLEVVQAIVRRAHECALNRL